MTWRMKYLMEGVDAKGAGGAAPPAWDAIKAALPEDLRNSEAIKDFKGVDGLVKSYVEAKSFLGNAIRIPGPDAPAEDLAAFREKLKKAIPDLVELPADPTKFAEVEGMIFERLGRPKEAKAYPTLKDSKIEIIDGVQVDEESLRATAIKLGFTKKQYLDFAREVVAERAQAVKLNTEARQALKKELGEAFDDRLSAAAMAAKKLGASEDVVKALRNGNVPSEQAKLWIGVAKALGTEGAELGAQGGSGDGKMTPAEARAQIDELYRNPAMQDARSPIHADLVKKLHQLTAIGYPE